MSDTFNDSEPSSVFYMNQLRSTRSIKSKIKSPSMSSEKLDLKIRIVKSIVDFKTLLHQKFSTMEMTLIIGFAICIMLQGILFYFLYTASGSCSCTENKNESSMFTPTPNPSDSEEDANIEPKLNPEFRKEKKDGWFWASQIYTKIDESNTQLINKIDTLIQGLASDILTKIQSEVEIQTELTKGFYLTMKNAEEVEFETPNRKGIKKTQGEESEDLPRRRIPIQPPKKPKPTSVWIGPTGIPGYAIHGYSG